ncbi:hypothetical protein Tco_0681783 [Tanacetum coccineum]|uniref:Uncharacterized protein n=1 Tax=Tanacetum coccineum TaxID=301880 RepID=A0ABQ4XPB3_9ASTR
MMTARKRFGALPTHRLAVRHSVDYSSSDHFSLDDSSRDSSSSSSSETSSGSSKDALSDSASSRSSSDHSLPTPSSGMRPSLHLCSLVPSVHRSSAAISDRPSHDSSSSINDNVVRSDGIGIDPEIHAEIDECIAYADALRDRGIDARVVVEAIDQEEIETGVRGPVEVRVDRVTHQVVADDIPEPAQEGAVEVTYETLGDLVQRFHDHTEEILVHRVQLERDNRRLRDMMDVASQRVAQSQRRELRVQREMRQIHRFRFYNRMRIARLEACARRHLGYCS